MKKVLVLLSLIYFISCVTEYCNKVEVIESADDCLTSQVEKETDNCCFLIVNDKGVNVNACTEVDKSYTLEQIEAALTKQYAEAGQTFVSLKCPDDQGTTPTPTPTPTPASGSYLRTGLLLLAAFLL